MDRVGAGDGEPGGAARPHRTGKGEAEAIDLQHPTPPLSQRVGHLVQSSRIAMSRSRRCSRISCASATCFSAVSASGASVKSTNLAGVPVIIETRQRYSGFFFGEGFEVLRILT